ncbi:MAG: DUF1800 family protein [Saprospiraceae bacterium]
MGALDKYSGSWTTSHVVHLYHRATYGASISQIKAGATGGLDYCTNLLFKSNPLPAPPINANYTLDPFVPIGQTWVNQPAVQGVNGYRTISLRAWAMENILTNQLSITEKMVVFWHNHFVTADINDPRMSYEYIQLLRKHALGNFKTMTEEITIDPAMLNYLNGRDNTRRAPNENYARELMELFTLGKGALAGPGDYTTFTELDVKEIARALTGWIELRDVAPIVAEYREARHDLSSKTLSHRFNNVVIENNGANEYKDVIRIIFDRIEVSEFIVTKFYKWFVTTSVTDDAKVNVIQPLAKKFREDNYEIKNVLQILLSSNHFYESCHLGALVKDPIAFVVNPLNTFSAAIPTNLADKYRYMTLLYGSAFILQMGMFQCPAVAGWQPTYQEPLYSKLWLNSHTLPTRKKYTDAIVVTAQTDQNFDFLSLLAQVSDPSDYKLVVSELTSYVFAFPLTENQVDVLSELLIPLNWTQVYNNYVADPNNTTKQTPLINRMRNLLIYIMRMPEFHLF